MRKLYDLRMGDADVRPSPYCWVAKWALLHKGLEFETVPLGFTDKEKNPDPEYGLVPVLDDNGELVRDSARIVTYLDEKYPEKPLVKTEGERAAVDFYWSWLGSDLLPTLGPLVIKAVYDALGPEDQPYFRETREKRFGRALETLDKDPSLPSKVEAALKTLAGPLKKHAYLGGDAPNHADYLVASFLMWPRQLSADGVYILPEAVDGWMTRMLDLYDGYARKSKRAPAAS